MTVTVKRLATQPLQSSCHLINLFLQTRVIMKQDFNYQQFDFNISMFLYRIERLLDIDIRDEKNKQEYQMIFDATMVLFRSLLLDSSKKVCSIQNFYRKINLEDYADRIDQLLDSPFVNWRTDSIRKTIKFISDKFICHQDNVTPADISWCNTAMSFLVNPAFDNNFQSIINKLYSIIKESYDKIPESLCKVFDSEG